jgi:hypothetical protein
MLFSFGTKMNVGGMNIMMITENVEMRTEVNPDHLEQWLINNPDKVYKRSAETASMLSKDKNTKEECFIEFMWEDDVYSKIHMKRSDIPKAMDKAIEYFVNHEMYEYAQMAKEAKEEYQSNK